MGRSRKAFIDGYEIQKFDGSAHFRLWQLRVRDILVLQGLEEGLGKRPSNKTDDEWEIINNRTVSIIRQTLADSVLYSVGNEASAEQLWGKLEDTYKWFSSRVCLKVRIFSLRMKEGTSIRDHIGRFKMLLFELSLVQQDIDEEDKALWLLISLPRSYKRLIQTMLHGKETVTLDEVTRLLLFDEAMKLAKKQERKAEAAEGRGRAQVLEYYDDRPRSRSRGPRSRSRDSRLNRTIICYACGKGGHIARFCQQNQN